jgi:hypothetical protein
MVENRMLGTPDLRTRFPYSNGAAALVRVWKIPAERERSPLAVGRTQIARLLRPGTGRAPAQTRHFPNRLLRLFVGALVLALAGCAQRAEPIRAGAVATSKTGNSPASPAANAGVRAEEIRMDCIKGRRLICGRVQKVLAEGLVVDSGYTDLLRPPLTESWVVPGNAVASREPGTLELNEAGTPCIGLVFLTDIPRRPQVKNHDYVIIMGYPAGNYLYTPAPGIEKVIRRFAGGLDTAVRLH